jgi:hypothetical protein
MTNESRALEQALARVYRPWLLHLFESRGWKVGPELARGIEEGERWLSDALEHLLSQAFDRQRRGPLEVFQEAMKFPTAVLVDLGVEAVERDKAAVMAVPGDLFDLAPASSSVLGEDVWRAHLAWGAAKAAGMRGH